MQTVLEITGGLLHAVFPRYFRWKEETAALNLLTRQILYVHTFFIALTVFLMGLLCVTCAADLIHTSLGRRVCMGLAAFWGIRLIIQFYGYSSKLWQGRIFETIMHVLFTLLWIHLTGVFFWACLPFD